MSVGPLLVFGHSGQVARDLRRQADVVALSRADADLSDPLACAATVDAHAPKAVINAAAYTSVDKAEQDEALATVINSDAPGAIARACAKRGIPFVQISTDYVFDGTGDAPWRPGDPTAPLGAYGRSKRLGEQGVRDAAECHAILRASWVFSAQGQNFVTTMLRLGAERDRISVVADQVGGPTPAAAIASACLSIADQLIADSSKSGTYHFSGTPDASWADFAREIFKQANLDCEVKGIPTSDYPTPAKRPANSRLDCSATEAAFGIRRPDWRAGLSDILSELGY